MHQNVQIGSWKWISHYPDKEKLHFQIKTDDHIHKLMSTFAIKITYFVINFNINKAFVSECSGKRKPANLRGDQSFNEAKNFYLFRAILMSIKTISIQPRLY